MRNQPKWPSIAVWTVLTLLVGTLVPSSSSAHAHLERSTPAEAATVTQMPASIHLTFTEGVETQLSRFAVYRLDPNEDRLAVEAQASQLISRVLNREDVDREPAHTGVIQPERGVSKTVELRLKDGLDAGPYVVLWRVLSVDTHVVEGYYVFYYDPAASQE